MLRPLLIPASEKFSLGFASALYALAMQGTAVSSEMFAVKTLAENVVESVESSQALFGTKARAISDLRQLQSEYAIEGWDGALASPISEFATFNAIAFVRALPDRFPIPEFSPAPDGSIVLDWIVSRNRRFSVSIDSGDRLPYAWLDGTDRGHAVAIFNRNQIPQRILDGVELIIPSPLVTVRIA